MDKRRWIAAAVLAGALALAGCGGDDEPESTSGEERQAFGFDRRLDHRSGLAGSAEDRQAVRHGLPGGQPRDDGNIEFVPWAQAHDKFTTSIAGGGVPDVAEMGTTWTPEFAAQGAFSEVQKPPEGEYVSSLVDAATLDDKVWGKPWYAGSRALIYRKDVLEKAGVEPPTTWDEMKAAAQAIKTKVPDIFPVGYTGLTEHMYLPTIWQAGGEIATQDGDTWKAALNSPQAAEAIDYYASFYKDGLAPKDAIGWEEPDAQTAFANGDLAMLVAGGWTYQAIIDTKPELKDKIGTVLEPAGPSSNTAFAGGSHLVVFKSPSRRSWRARSSTSCSSRTS